MKWLLVLSVVVAQLSSCFGKPASEGVGAFAYQDTKGNRYGGTYGLKDGKVSRISGDDVTTFSPDEFPGFQSLDNFFPEYFRNFENLLQEAFSDHLEHQQVALDAARKAFDLTSNQAGYVPNFDFDIDSRFAGFPGFGGPGFGFGMPFGGNNGFPGFPMRPMMGPNSAFAGAAAGPGFNAHKIALNPSHKPDIDVTQLSDPSDKQGGGRRFYSVSSSSFASSANMNGEPITQRGGQTIINDNGKVTKYSLVDP